MDGQRRLKRQNSRTITLFGMINKLEAVAPGLVKFDKPGGGITVDWPAAAKLHALAVRRDILRKFPDQAKLCAARLRAEAQESVNPEAALANAELLEKEIVEPDDGAYTLLVKVLILSGVLSSDLCNKYLVLGEFINGEGEKRFVTDAGILQMYNLHLIPENTPLAFVDHERGVQWLEVARKLLSISNREPCLTQAIFNRA